MISKMLFFNCLLIVLNDVQCFFRPNEQPMKMVMPLKQFATYGYYHRPRPWYYVKYFNGGIDDYPYQKPAVFYGRMSDGYEFKRRGKDFGGRRGYNNRKGTTAHKAGKFVGEVTSDVVNGLTCPIRPHGRAGLVSVFSSALSGEIPNQQLRRGSSRRSG